MSFFYLWPWAELLICSPPANGKYSTIWSIPSSISSQHRKESLTCLKWFHHLHYICHPDKLGPSQSFRLKLKIIPYNILYNVHYNYTNGCWRHLITIIWTFCTITDVTRYSIRSIIMITLFFLTILNASDWNLEQNNFPSFVL